jgi:hypothetical protein
VSPVRFDVDVFIVEVLSALDGETPHLAVDTARSPATRPKAWSQRSRSSNEADGSRGSSATLAAHIVDAMKERGLRPPGTFLGSIVEAPITRRLTLGTT